MDILTCSNCILPIVRWYLKQVLYKFIFVKRSVHFRFGASLPYVSFAYSNTGTKIFAYASICVGACVSVIVYVCARVCACACRVCACVSVRVCTIGSW